MKRIDQLQKIRFMTSYALHAFKDDFVITHDLITKRVSQLSDLCDIEITEDEHIKIVKIIESQIPIRMTL